jgi:hypothetical protein
MAEAWHRRHAIQIAAALPETREDALIVLEFARELVERFWPLRGVQEARPVESASAAWWPRRPRVPRTRRVKPGDR